MTKYQDNIYREYIKERYGKMKIASVNVPSLYLQIIDAIISTGIITSRSEFIRVAIYERLINMLPFFHFIENKSSSEIKDFLKDILNDIEKIENITKSIKIFKKQEKTIIEQVKPDKNKDLTNIKKVMQDLFFYKE